VFASVSVLSLALLALEPNAAQAQVKWSGWAICDIRVTGPSYGNSEVHVWVVKDAEPGTAKTGNWTVTGSGQWSPAQQLSRWNISSGVSTSQSTDFLVSVSGGQVSIARTSNPSSVIAGYTISIPGGELSKILAQRDQWAFPTVTGSSTMTQLTGSYGPVTHLGPAWGLLRPSGSTTEASCGWLFTSAAVPSLPPLAPMASGVAITGTPVLGRTLTGNYVYSDLNGDLQGGSTFRWLRNGREEISGQSTRFYTLGLADVGKNVSFEVTAQSQGQPATMKSVPVESGPVGPVTCLEPVPRSKSSAWQRLVDSVRSLFGATIAPSCPAGCQDFTCPRR
jgi:hypothetical protein